MNHDNLLKFQGGMFNAFIPWHNLNVSLSPFVIPTYLSNSVLHFYKNMSSYNIKFFCHIYRELVIFNKMDIIYKIKIINVHIKDIVS